MGRRFLGVVLFFGLFGMFVIFKEMKSHAEEKPGLSDKQKERNRNFTNVRSRVWSPAQVPVARPTRHHRSSPGSGQQDGPAQAAPHRVCRKLTLFRTC